MKYRVLAAVLAVSLSACGVLKPHEKLAQTQAEQAGLVAVAKPRLDATFVLPHANLGQYKKIILSDLDLSAVKIYQPNSKFGFDEPWELNKDDRAYYQAKYTESAKEFLFGDGKYTAATTAGADTLLLKTKITDIAPLASKDDLKGRPNIMDVYSEGFGRMTIVFEVYDSASNKLLMITSDEHDLGKIWEKNTRVQNNIQIKLAFDFWLNYFNKELVGVSKK
jgi:hypothetical protein